MRQKPRKKDARHFRRASLLTLWSPFSLHLGELLEESVVLLEALLGGLEHLLRLLRTDLLHELLEAVLAEFLRDRVLRERDRVGLVGRVELELARRRIVGPEREVDGVDRRLLVRTPKKPLGAALTTPSQRPSVIV